MTASATGAPDGAAPGIRLLDERVRAHAESLPATGGLPRGLSRPRRLQLPQTWPWATTIVTALRAHRRHASTPTDLRPTYPFTTEGLCGTARRDNRPAVMHAQEICLTASIRNASREPTAA